MAAVRAATDDAAEPAAEPDVEEQAPDSPGPPRWRAAPREAVVWLGGSLQRRLLVGAMVVFSIVYGRLVYMRHDRFASFTLDMAIFDQATWVLSRLDGFFMSIRGLDFLGHHANLGLILFAPFYWFGAGPHFLNLVQVGAVALAAVPVFLIARERLGNEWYALAMSCALLLNPSIGFFLWELFHPETMAIVGLLFAYWFAMKRSWTWCTVSLVYSVSWKEDVALAALAFGVVLLAWRHRKAGVIAIVSSLAYFTLVNRWMLPHFAGSTFYNNLFGELGNTPTEVARTALTDPTRITDKVFAKDARAFYWQMSAPFACLAAFGPLALLIGIPQAFIDVISSAGFTRVYYYHYAALPFVGIMLGSIEGMAWLSRNRPQFRAFLAGLVAASAVVGAVLWGVSPIGHQYEKGWWPLHADARLAAKKYAVSLPPDNAGVSATYHFTPHMTHRRDIFDFPTPWFSSNWGVNGENLPDPDRAEWLVIDRQVIGEQDRLLADYILSNGEFEIVFAQYDIVVARRVRPSSETITREQLATTSTTLPPPP
jgi:uncharacterized membrane protein